jgi:cytochrome c-type biogenesis protein CcmH/NrfG
MVLVGCETAQPGPSVELQNKQNATFQEMLKDPGNLEVVMAYAQAATKAGDYEGAVAAYEGMLIIDLRRVAYLPRIGARVARPPCGRSQTDRAAAGEDAEAVQVPAHLTR